MTTTASFPAELLFIIFSKLNKVKALTECRLVCKAWKDPAERAIFVGHPIIIPFFKRETYSLYSFLSIDPAKANLIKHVHFDQSALVNTNLIREILRLVLNPNIESISGNIEQLNKGNLFDNAYLDLIMDVIESSHNSLERLKTLTLTHTHRELPPVRLALHCKQSIQTMKLDLSYQLNINWWSFIGRFKEFNNLTWLALKCPVENSRNFDRIVDGCPHLQELTLISPEYGWDFDNEDDEDDEGDEDAEVLNQHIVQPHLSLKILNIRGDVSHDCICQLLMEYFLRKFVSLESISVEIYLFLSIYYDNEDIITRHPRLIEKVQQKELIYTLQNESEIKDVAYYLTKSGYSIIVEIGEYSTHVKIVL